jgi:hypothetical protein
MFMAILGDRAHSVTDLSGRTSLATLGRVLAKLDLLVSADTGVIHMAAAVDTPIVAAFGGPALAGETGPYSRKATIIQGYGPCSPCREGPNCRLSVCPYLPGPGPIAWAARSILGLPRLESHEESFKDEGFHRTYRPIYDAFGQNLVVDSSFESTTDYDFADEEDLAMAIRTAGIAALKLDQYHQTLAAQGLDKKDGQALKVSQNPSGAHRLMETVRSIADLAFSDLETKRRFVLTADAILFARQN